MSGHGRLARHLHGSAATVEASQPSARAGMWVRRGAGGVGPRAQWQWQWRLDRAAAYARARGLARLLARIEASARRNGNPQRRGQAGLNAPAPCSRRARAARGVSRPWVGVPPPALSQGQARRSGGKQHVHARVESSRSRAVGERDRPVAAARQLLVVVHDPGARRCTAESSSARATLSLRAAWPRPARLARASSPCAYQPSTHRRVGPPPLRPPGTRRRAHATVPRPGPVFPALSRPCQAPTDSGRYGQ